MTATLTYTLLLAAIFVTKKGFDFLDSKESTFK